MEVITRSETLSITRRLGWMTLRLAFLNHRQLRFLGSQDWECFIAGDVRRNSRPGESPMSTLPVVMFFSFCQFGFDCWIRKLWFLEFLARNVVCVLT
jgi:hypothetical protein